MLGRWNRPTSFRPSPCGSTSGTATRSSAGTASNGRTAPRHAPLILSCRTPALTSWAERIWSTFYKYSMTCLENARDILQVLEQEYHTTFGKKLTIRRLGAIISNPRMPARWPTWNTMSTFPVPVRGKRYPEGAAPEPVPRMRIGGINNAYS